MTKLEAFQWYKVTKLNPSKPSPLVCLLLVFLHAVVVLTAVYVTGVPAEAEAKVSALSKQRTSIYPVSDIYQRCILV